MSFAYQVLSEQEAMQERFQLLKEGISDAVIEASEDKVSVNSGNPMMDIVLTVYDENGKPHAVRDFLVFTKSMMWKVVHCANSAGLLQEYGDGKFCSEVVIGKRVRVKINVESGGVIPADKLKDKPFGSKYPDKNKIEDYVKKEDHGIPAAQANDELNDDIPF